MTTGIEEERNRIRKAQQIAEWLRKEYGTIGKACEAMREGDHVWRRGVENNMGLKHRPSAATWLVVAALLEAQWLAYVEQTANEPPRGKRVRRSA